jgi:general secretion pathway protein G
MLKKSPGFTLLEMMIVIAIIGLLIALVIPSVTEKIQHGKQVATMHDMSTIANACIEYLTENNEAPAAQIQNGPLTPDCDFIKALTQKHLTTCPTKDKWGNPFIVYSGEAVAEFSGFSKGLAGKSDFLIISYGRYGRDEHFTFDPDNREAGLFKVANISDYDKNLINWNGTWIRAPK